MVFVSSGWMSRAICQESSVMMWTRNIVTARVYSTTITKSIDIQKGYDNLFGYRQSNGLQQQQMHHPGLQAPC